MSVISDLLKVLEKNRGKFISGQEFARTLNVSRTAVWKAINKLKEEGYPIKSTPNRGYMLADESRILSVEAIEGHLSSSAEQASVTVLKSTDSTNNEAKRMIMHNSGFGSVIFAEEQSSGRGRMGRSFSSPPGDNIYVSFILQPMLDVHDSLLITIAASVAVARAIKKMGRINGKSLKPQIKWVNDVFLNNKKICGILTEAVSNIENGQIESLILGIGINVNMDMKDYPEELRDIAGSIDLAPGQRNLFAATLINEVFNIQTEISDYCNFHMEEPSFMDEYREMSLVPGKNIFVIRDSEKLEAKALDIDSRGGLLVEYKSGETEVLNTGEISIRLNP